MVADILELASKQGISKAQDWMYSGTRREATACLLTAFSVCEGVDWCLPCNYVVAEMVGDL